MMHGVARSSPGRHLGRSISRLLCYSSLWRPFLRAHGTYSFSLGSRNIAPDDVAMKCFYTKQQNLKENESIKTRSLHPSQNSKSTNTNRRHHSSVPLGAKQSPAKSLNLLAYRSWRPPPPPPSRTTTERPVPNVHVAPSIGNPYSTTSTSRSPPTIPAGSAAPPAQPQLPAAEMPTLPMATDKGNGQLHRPCSDLHRRGSEQKVTTLGRRASAAPETFITTRAAMRRTSTREATMRTRPGISASRLGFLLRRRR